MDMLKGLGGFANSWAKFIVGLLALGWFGAYAIDELRTPRIASTVEAATALFDENRTAEDATSHDAPETAPVPRDAGTAVEGKPQLTSSLFAELRGEAVSLGSRLAGNPTSHLVFTFLAGSTLGLLARPALNRFNQYRRLRAARRRVFLLEQDRQLLASAGGGVPGHLPAVP